MSFATPPSSSSNKLAHECRKCPQQRQQKLLRLTAVVLSNCMKHVGRQEWLTRDTVGKMPCWVPASPASRSRKLLVRKTPYTCVRVAQQSVCRVQTLECTKLYPRLRPVSTHMTEKASRCAGDASQPLQASCVGDEMLGRLNCGY